MSVLTTHANVRLRREHPELMPVFEWSGWPDGTTYHHRWQIAEVLWILRHKGPAEHAGNASKVVRDWAREMGAEATATLTSQGWSNLYGEMGGRVAVRRSYHWDPPLLIREIAGKSTKYIGLNPAITDFPPDPFALLREHREKVAAARAESRAFVVDGSASADVEESRPPTRSELPPDPGDGAARLRQLLNLRGPENNGGPTPAPEPAPTPAPEPEPEPTPGPEEAVVALNGTHVDALDVRVAELDSWLSGAAQVEPPVEDVVEPAIPAVSGLADQLVTVGDRSMVDNVRLLMSLAGDMLTQAMVAEVTPEPVTVEVEVPVEDDTVKRRLADALEEAGRLRKAVQTAQTKRQMAEKLARSTEAALRAEREKTQALESNLERVLRGEKAENSRALRTVQRFMAEKPKVKAGV